MNAKTAMAVTGSRGAVVIHEKRNLDGTLEVQSVETSGDVAHPTGWCGTESHPTAEHPMRPGCIAFIQNR